MGSQSKSWQLGCADGAPPRHPHLPTAVSPTTPFSSLGLTCLSNHELRAFLRAMHRGLTALEWRLIASQRHLAAGGPHWPAAAPLAPAWGISFSDIGATILPLMPACIVFADYRSALSQTRRKNKPPTPSLTAGTPSFLLKRPAQRRRAYPTSSKQGYCQVGLVRG